MQLGDKVKATVSITEEAFNGSAIWTHAEAGDVGVVECVDAENLDDVGQPLATVRFERSGTATVVASEEVVRIYQEGDAVQAIVKITDCVTGQTHAEPGDVGTVVAVYPDAIGPTVTWTRSGTTYDVADEEVRFLRHFRPQDSDDMETTGRWVWAPCACCDGVGQVLETTTDMTVTIEAVVTCPACRGSRKHLVRL